MNKSMSLRFKDKVVIVTGAAQGIGRGVALEAAREGASLVLADRSPLVLEVLAEVQSGRDFPAALAIACEVDLETHAGARELACAAVAAFGRIDVLINNVGGTIWAKPYQEYEPDQIEAEIRRSLFPTLWCCHAVLPAMIELRRLRRLDVQPAVRPRPRASDDRGPRTVLVTP